MKKVLISTVAFALGAAGLKAAVFYGTATSVRGGLDQTIAWYADEACTITSGVVSPYGAGAGDHSYVILSSAKVESESSFPDVTTYFGTDGATVGSAVASCHHWNLNVGSVTFPKATVFSSSFEVNGNYLTRFLGEYNLVKTSEPIVFAGVNITGVSTRGADLAGKFTGAADVVVDLTGTSADKVTATSTIKFTGDFSGFKGSFVAHEMSFADQYSRGEKILDIKLLSSTALGDDSHPRDDALCLANDSHLTISDQVAQSGRRGVRLMLSGDEKAYLNADSGQEWTLKAPLSGTGGTVVKEGSGTIRLDGPVDVPALSVASGILVLGTNFSARQTIDVSLAAGTTLLTMRDIGELGIHVSAAEGAVVSKVVYAEPSYPDRNSNDNRWVLPTTDEYAGEWLWSDHLAAHGNAEYVIDTGVCVVSGNQGYHPEMVFPGRSLTIGNSCYITRAITNEFASLVLNDGARIQSAGCGAGEVPHRMKGVYTINGTVDFVASHDGSRQTTYDIQAELKGAGNLKFGGSAVTDYFISSASPDYAGTITLGCGTEEGSPVAIEFEEATSLGGALAAFKYDAVQCIGARNGLKPRKTTVLNALNRGVYFGESGAFIDTPEDVEFEIDNPVRIKKGLAKRGAGTLSFGGRVTAETSDGTRNKLTIEGGFVKALVMDAMSDLVLYFAAGSGIAVDGNPSDANAERYGFVLTNDACMASEGAIRVRLDNAEEKLSRKSTICIAICTLPASAPDMTSVFQGVRPAKGYECAIRKEALQDGRVRYMADFVHGGMCIIIR